MTRFTKSLSQWGTEAFSKTLKQELETLESGVLPLNLATTQGGLVDDANICALINQVTDSTGDIQIKAGIFFNEIIAGCNCNDDPVSDNTYCELLVIIDKTTAAANISLLTT